MRIKCYYNRNLKMSPEKLAAQIGHVAIGVSNFYMNHHNEQPNYIIVLGASPSKMKSIRSELQEKGVLVYTQVDLGLTEVPEGSETAIGYVEIYNDQQI